MNIDSLVLLAGCLILGWLVAHFAKPPQGLISLFSVPYINTLLP